jgi:uncharacterized protein
MTPAERQLVTELFDRLATLEDAARDPEAERLIKDGLRQAPNATYALVQSVLVQDEALKRADGRIRDLENELGIQSEPQRSGGFLDSMRATIFGRQDERRGSVPNVRPGDAPMGAPPGFQTGAQPLPPQSSGFGGGSFLGTAAAAAAGVIGGSLLLDSIRGMTGHRGGSGLGLADPAAARDSPWSGNAGGGDLARQAGLDDIGRDGGADGGRSADQGYGLFDTSSDNPPDDGVDNELPEDEFDDGSFDLGGDGGGTEP